MVSSAGYIKGGSYSVYREQGGGIKGVTKGVKVTDLEKASRILICPYAKTQTGVFRSKPRILLCPVKTMNTLDQRESCLYSKE